MLAVTVSVTGLTEAQRALENVAAIFEDMSPETELIGEHAKEYFQTDVYDSSGAVLGSPWAPLSEPYATYKAKRYGSTAILVASGQMKQSYSIFSTADYVIIQNDAINKDGNYYARYHQDGTPRMPQRLLMDLSDQLLIDTSLIITQSLSERLLGAMI